MKSQTTQEQILELQHQLDEVNESIENYFEGDNSEHFGEEYYRNLENRGKGGGWRWHKWGTYIGTLDPQCEYLDDEDFGEDFKYVLCFHLYHVKEK